MWLVTDGTAEAGGWLEPFKAALESIGATSVDVLGVSGVIGQTARGLIGQGAERLARLSFVRRGLPDANVFEVMADARPDLVLVDHPGILRALEVIRDTTGTGAVHVAVVASLALADWADARADGFVVPAAADPAGLRRPELAAEALQLAGPPVPAGFARAPDPESARAELGLGGAAVVMVDALGMDPQTVDAVVGQIGRVRGVDAIFHYGTDRALADSLRTAAAVRGVAANMFGHVDDIETFAVAADAVVIGARPGAAAAFATLGVPVFALDPGATIASAGAGVVPLRSPEGLAAELGRLADGTSGLAPSRRPSRADTATADAAGAVARIWASRARLRVATQPAAPPPTPTASAAPSPSRRLEPIGGGVAPNAPFVGALEPLSREAAREMLAALILDERRVEADIASFAAERDKWLNRLTLAEEQGQADLVGYASGLVRDLTARIGRANDEIGVIQQKKADVRRRAAAGSSQARAGERIAVPGAPEPGAPGTAAPEDFEARFRRLERDGELDRLRRRALGDDAGDDSGEAG